MEISERPTVNNSAVIKAPSRTSRQVSTTSGKILNMAANRKVTTNSDKDNSRLTIAQPGTSSHSSANTMTARKATDNNNETKRIKPMARIMVSDSSRLLTKT